MSISIPPPAWRVVTVEAKVFCVAPTLLELTPEGIRQYGGGYTEYVARTGHEAPGLRS